MLTPELYPVFKELESLQLDLACSMELLRTISKMGEEVSNASNPCIDFSNFAYLVFYHYQAVSNALDSFESKFSDLIKLLPKKRKEMRCD